MNFFSLPVASIPQVVYEFFLRFIVSSEVNAKTCKKYADQPFCFQLIELFDLVFSILVVLFHDFFKPLHFLE